MTTKIIVKILRFILLIVMLFFFNSICYSQTIDILLAEIYEELINRYAESENINIEVLFFNYRENAIHFSYSDGGWSWHDIVYMKILSEEYKDKILQIIIGEYPARREQFRIERIYTISVNKRKLEGNLQDIKPERYFTFGSSDIIFIE